MGEKESTPAISEISKPSKKRTLSELGDGGDDIDDMMDYVEYVSEREWYWSGEEGCWFFRDPGKEWDRYPQGVYGWRFRDGRWWFKKGVHTNLG